MRDGHARVFKSLRPYVLERLVEMRGSIDHMFASADAEAVRDQFDQVLDRMQLFLQDGDVERFRGFVTRWVALRLGEGFAPENVIHALVAFADTVVQIGKHRIGADAEAMAFARAVTAMSLTASRIVVQVYAADMETRQRQLSTVSRR